MKSYNKAKAMVLFTLNHVNILTEIKRLDIDLKTEDELLTLRI